MTRLGGAGDIPEAKIALTTNIIENQNGNRIRHFKACFSLHFFSELQQALGSCKGLYQHHPLITLPPIRHIGVYCDIISVALRAISMKVGR